MNFDTPHLVQFITRDPWFEKPNEAIVNLELDADVQLRWPSDDYRRLSVNVSHENIRHLVSSIAQVCNMCLPPLTTVENLRLEAFKVYSGDWDGDSWDDRWLELLRPFTAVKSLYLSTYFQPYLETQLASALQELVGCRTMEVLPSLQNIYLAGFEPSPSGSFLKAISPFLAARQLSGHPIAVLPL